MNDFEGFYARMVKRLGVPSRGAHQFDFPEDVMRNEENMTIQANKKSYWKTYEEMLSQILQIDPSYDPLPNCKDWAQRVRIVLNNFVDVYDTMNEKLGYGKKCKLTIVHDKE